MRSSRIELTNGIGFACAIVLLCIGMFMMLTGGSPTFGAAFILLSGILSILNWMTIRYDL